MINVNQSIKSNMTKIANMHARGIVGSADPTQETQSLQVDLMADESHDDIEHPQEYGFASVPTPGAEVIAGFMGGNRSNGYIAHAFDKRYKPTDLAPGESCIHDNNGNRVVIRQSGNIEITATAGLVITAPTMTLTGNLVVQGNIIDQSGSNTHNLAQMRTIYNAHTHVETGGTTNPTSSTQ